MIFILVLVCFIFIIHLNRLIQVILFNYTIKFNRMYRKILKIIHLTLI